MPGNDQESVDELHYIQLENLPWSACHNDVLKFLEGIDVLPGGISIFCRDAYIVISNEGDARKALSLSGKKLNGTPVYLISSTKQEMFRRKCRYITRRLRMLPSLKKIRPTVSSAIPKNMFEVFNPDEICPPDENKEIMPLQPKERRVRKIRPTALKDLTQFQVHEGREADASQCVKKRRLSDD